MVRPFSEFVGAGFLAIRRSDSTDNQLAERFISGFGDYHETLLALFQEANRV